MKIIYNESVVLAGVTPRGPRVTYDDMHKTAWDLYSGWAHRPGATRTFIYRFEPVNAARFMFTIRSGEPFYQSERKVLSVNSGDRMAVALATPAIVRRGDRVRHLGRDEAEQKIMTSMECVGATVERVMDQRLMASYALKPRTDFSFRLDDFEMGISVRDEIGFADAFLGGIGRKRGYGGGLMQIQAHPEQTHGQGQSA